MKKSMPIGRPVLVTTAHRGVFFGYADATGGPTIRLERARCIIYWSKEVKDFIVLASDGPTTDRVGPAVTVTLRDITCVAEVTPAAVKAWEKAPWIS